MINILPKKSDDCIGYVVLSKYNEKAEIIKYTLNNKCLNFYLKFENGYIKYFRKTQIKNGDFKNPYTITVSGIGYLGDYDKNYDFLYDRWYSMISRCYNENDTSYNSYGAIGITVCENWFNFSNYIHDVITINGYNETLVKNGTLQLDKDIKNRECKEYSYSNCLWVSQKVNNQERNFRVNSKFFKIITPEGEIKHIKNMKEFTLQNNLDRSCMIKVAKGTREQHKGYKCFYEDILGI